MAWQRVRIFGLIAAIAVFGLFALVATVPWIHVPRLTDWTRPYLPLWLALLTAVIVFGVALLLQGKRDFLLLFQSEGDKQLSVSLPPITASGKPCRTKRTSLIPWNFPGRYCSRSG